LIADAIGNNNLKRRKVFKLVSMLFICTLVSCSTIQNNQEEDLPLDSSMPYNSENVTGRVIEYGIYDILHDGGIIPSKNTSTGKAHAPSTLKLRSETQRVAIKKGRFFGFKIRLEPFPGLRSVTLKEVVKHPAMTLPDGSVKTGFSIIEKKKVSQQVVFALAGYYFDEPYEMVPGDWVFQYWLGDRLLVEQIFTTYWPESL